MREINEAWNVLREPVSRRRYDEARGVAGRRQATRGTSPARAAAPPPAVPDDDDLVDVAPDLGPLASLLMRHLPWVVLVAAFLLILVVTAYAGPGSHAGSPAVTRPVAAPPGTCLDVRSGPTTTVVPCTGRHDVLVVARVDEATRCPAGTERRRLSTDGRLDCVQNG